MHPMAFTRRDFLSAGLMAAALPCAPATALFAKPQSKSWQFRRKTVSVPGLVSRPKRRAKSHARPAANQRRRQKAARNLRPRLRQEVRTIQPTDLSPTRRSASASPRKQPSIGNPGCRPMQPWEKSISSPTVLFEKGKYRCWYIARLKGESEKSTVDDGRAMSVTGSALAYAESTDGEKWVKPSLKILSYQGSVDNNLVCPFNNGGAIFRDDHGPPEERYKGFNFDKLPAEKDSTAKGPQAAVRSLRRLVARRLSLDEKSKTAWFATSPTRPTSQPGIRCSKSTWATSVTTSAAAQSPAPKRPTSGTGPSRSRCCIPGPMDSPADDYYTNCYTTYPGDPSLRLIFPAIYHHDNDSVDIRLGVSRDGRAYQWASLEPIIKLGAPGEWDCGSIYADPQLVHLPDGRLALPYGGFNTTHNEVWFQNFYGDYDVKGAFAWATWKDARLAGIEAVETGQFAMASTTFNGKEIQINARTSRAGMVEVELRQNGQPVKGFSFDDCLPFSGDEVWAPCRWKDADVAEIAGKEHRSAFPASQR